VFVTFEQGALFFGFFFFWLWVGDAGGGNLGLAHAQKVPYHLSYIPNLGPENSVAGDGDSSSRGFWA
jgi:hypothetical protein